MHTELVGVVKCILHCKLFEVLTLIRRDSCCELCIDNSRSPFAFTMWFEIRVSELQYDSMISVYYSIV